MPKYIELLAQSNPNLTTDDLEYRNVSAKHHLLAHLRETSNVIETTKETIEKLKGSPDYYPCAIIALQKLLKKLEQKKKDYEELLAEQF